jgi:DNA-binding transcriptional MerR regulator
MLTIGAFAQLGQVSPRTLRHYDDLGLLTPEHVDPSTGYRSYELAQLGRLHRILALRDLGFALEQIGAVLDGDLSLDELRGMLRLRRAQIQSVVSDEQARLRRVEARLRFLERSGTMPVPDVVVKTTQPLRLAEANTLAAGFGAPLMPAFMEVVPKVVAHLERAGAQPGLRVAWYEMPEVDDGVVLHFGFGIGDQRVPETDGIVVHELPEIEVASVVHHGGMDDVEPVYEALVRWIDESGYTVSGYSRELYLEFHEQDMSRNVTELQMPITK